MALKKRRTEHTNLTRMIDVAEFTPMVFRSKKVESSLFRVYLLVI